MAFPKYNKVTRSTYETLPRGAYVIKIMNAVEDTYPSGDRCIRIAFDIAEGEYAGIYDRNYKADTREDKQWPYDAVFTLPVPNDNSKGYVWTNWFSFFSNLEDSNNGFVFDAESGNLKSLRGKVLGGKFAIRQTEKNGTIYDHTQLRWTCVADDVREGHPGKMPNDKLLEPAPSARPSVPDDFVSVPEGIDDELPFA